MKMGSTSGHATYDDFLDATARTVHSASRKLIFTDAWNDVTWLLGQRIQSYTSQLSTLPWDEEHDRERLVLLTQLQTLTGFITWINTNASEQHKDEPTPVYVG